MYSKGRVHTIPLDCSLIMQIVCSALLTCSFAAVALHIKDGNLSFTLSNSPSIRIVRTVNPARAYTWTTHVKYLLRLLAVQVATYSAVINLICLDTLNKNAVPSIKIHLLLTSLFCSTPPPLLVPTHTHLQPASESSALSFPAGLVD
jgi:hypothetical protein